MRRIKATVMTIAILASAAGLAAIALKHSESKTFTGAVLVADSDVRKQLPIPNVRISLKDGIVEESVTSDSAGFFRLAARQGVVPEKRLTLSFRHPDYQPLDIPEGSGDQIYVARMTPVIRTPAPVDGKMATVRNVRVRYAMSAPNTINIGSAVKSFEVVNTGNVRCDQAGPCSPDGKWKATIGGASIEAGLGNQFRNMRISCIAGACPFSRVENDGVANQGRTMNISIRAWSDTVTYLAEAEVWHTVMSDEIRQGYPAIFGPEMDFTLPSGAQGLSIQASVDGMDIVFPVGPSLMLSWAACSLTENGAGKLYRCSLKSGYRFQ